MIFSIGDHIEQIKAGTKTQTRRQHDRYAIGQTYAIQPKRGARGIPDGVIRITDLWWESQESIEMIPEESYWAEGGYTCPKYEELYEKMYPGWKWRVAYEFEFVQSSSGSVKK